MEEGIAGTGASSMRSLGDGSFTASHGRLATPTTVYPVDCRYRSTDLAHDSTSINRINDASWNTVNAVKEQVISDRREVSREGG
jgi:hypothetical protein